MGLDTCRHAVSWEETDSNKKQKGVKKKTSDRYFSAVSQQLLRSEPGVPTLPKIPDCSDATSPTSFLPLGHDEETKGELGQEI